MSLDKSNILATDLPSDAAPELANFFEKYFLQGYSNLIEKDSYHITKLNGTVTISWNVGIEQKVLRCELKIEPPNVELIIQNSSENDPSRMELMSRTTDAVENIVTVFIQRARMNTLYFVVGTGDETHSEAPAQSTGRSVFRRIFSGNTTNVFLAITFVSFILFFTIGFIALFILVAAQLVYLVFSDRAILNMGNVHPSSDMPFVSVVSVRVKAETAKFLRLHAKKMLTEMRDDVGKLHVPLNSPGDQLKQSISSILSRYGISLNPEDIGIRTRNVYELVKKVAGEFNQPVPKIVIANTIVSNAAATGVSKNRSSMMITAGSLEDLSDEELESTVGHELGHIKGHDSTILFGLTSFQYLGMFYLWYPLVLYLGIFYFVIAFGVIFAFGKVLETRADTESAVVLRDPDGLALGLKKIGFAEFYYEKYSTARRILAWFRFDPHPPIYFRINRMSEFSGGKTTRHSFLISLRDCVVGFLSSFT